MSKKKASTKKKSGVRVFFGGLLKSLLSIVVILAVGFCSYKISYALISDDETEIDDITADSLEDIKSEATTDEISKNLIYVCNDKNKITHLMLEICNTDTDNMDYVTIPVNTYYTIPSVMYRKLCQINPEIPQVVHLSDMKLYFDDENDAYGYGVLIFEKMLGVDISYYTVISQDIYKNHYDQQQVTVAYRASTDEDSAADSTSDTATTDTDQNTLMTTSMKISVLSEGYKNQIADLNADEENIAEFIKQQYERDGVDSNLTVYNKIGYVEAYRQMNPEYFHYWGVPGTYENGVFSVDTKATKKALKALTENTETYTGAQDLTMVNRIKTSGSSEDDGTDYVSSFGYDILVLNGSRVSGIASATKEQLEAAGYSVPEVGNYTDEVLTTTRIIVREEGLGKDLATYFNDPEIVVGEVTEGYDIEIIIGTADAGY